ncbi:hypothetical protein LZD49_27165 [Dyadobacter sp. CY261]|uniref:hypothetical protein n=1 Tax=Dyadobacter sp. CY261 TaxID=2907203 RepID=UPI001F477CF8|nr:hypothetical protein [Dyadobacter sp. CY261]MCF0074194.1 hypothetical protein [Dyadobacter sp. CY261]
MLTKNNRIQVLCLIAVTILSSCASVKVKEVSHVEAKADDCRLPVFNDVKEINGGYTVVCEVESTTGSVLFVKRTAEAAIERAMPAACRCGADALLVLTSGKTQIKFFSWRRGIATVQAIKTNQSASR